MTEAEFDVGRDEPSKITEVMTDTIMDNEMYRPLGDRQINGIGTLQLPALARLDDTKGFKIACTNMQCLVATRFDG